jgi:hypothetical protein
MGALETLPNPISSNQWRRITFLYTTGELLRNAQTVHDLVVRDEERDLLWQSLRERAIRSSQYAPEDLPEDQFKLDPQVLAMLGGLDNFHEPPGVWDEN